MENPKVSVIVAVYNDETYIRKAIDSVFNQTFQDFEIIVVNDGSTDGTRSEVLSNFGKNEKLKYIELKNNQGASYAANIAIKESRGEYVALLCSDDEFLPTRLEKQIEFLDKNDNVAVCFTDINFIDDKGVVINNIQEVTKELLPCARYVNDFKVANKTGHEWLRFFISNSHSFFPSSALIRKSCLNEVGHLNPLFHQVTDLDLWVRFCLKYDVYQLEDKLINSRVHFNKDRNNVSINTDVSIKRSGFEMKKVFNNYFELSGEDIFKVFPKLNEIKCLYQDDLKEFFIIVGFYLYFPSNRVLHFSILDKFYQILQDEKILQKLFDLGFTLKDWIDISGDIEEGKNIFKNLVLCKRIKGL